MGFLRRKGTNDVNLLMPDGSKPEFTGQEGFSNFLRALTITPEKYEGFSNIPKIDQNAYFDAAAALVVLGVEVSSTERLLAFGSIIIEGLPGYQGQREATGIAGDNYLIVRFRHKLKFNYFAAPYDEIEGINSAGEMQALLTFRNSMLLDKRGRQILKNQKISLAFNPSKDGHENRRGLSFWYTNSHMLKSKFLNEE